MAECQSERRFVYTLEDLSLTLESDYNDSIGKESGKECSSATGKTMPLLPSNFDRLLTSLWEEAMKKGFFRYQLTKNCLPLKLLPGKFNYIAQLNPDRAQKRRQPQEIQSVNQPFDPNQFHLNKVHPREVLLRIEPPSCSDPQVPPEHALLINVSPLEYCHVLLTPFRNECRPQNITRESLRLALELLLLSNSSDLRVGFNSLCGYASVNHEHYHAYFLSHRLYIEHAPLVRVSTNDLWHHFQDPQYPPGFCVVLDDLSESGMNGVLNATMMIAEFLQSNNIGHNLYATRGSTKNIKGHFDSIRIFVWARTSSFGAKECDAFNPALCELAGHFPVKSVEAFACLTEDYILKELHEICDEPFSRTMEWLRSTK